MDNENRINKATQQIAQDETIRATYERQTAITEYLRLQKLKIENVYLCYNEGKRRFWVSVIFTSDYLKSQGNFIIKTE